MGRPPSVVQNLRANLAKSFPRDALMPAERGAKHPMMCHRPAPGVSARPWTTREFDGFCDQRSTHDLSRLDYCVLLVDLCVVDVDSKERADELERAFPELRQTVRVETQRGRHYYFRRPLVADIEGYHDGAGQREAGIDFKTVCSNGTSGVIMVPPSGGKDFVGSAKSTEWDRLPAASTALLDAVAVPVHRRMNSPLAFEGGTTLCPERVRTFRAISAFSYFDPFFDDLASESTAVPVPCAAPEFELLMRVLDVMSFDASVQGPSRDMLRGLVDLADKLGLSARLMRRLRHQTSTGTLRAQLDLFEGWPEMYAALGSESRDPEELVRVDSELARRLVHVPIAWPGESGRLFPDALPRLDLRARVLRDDPAGSIAGSLSPAVLGLLRKHAPKLVLAGGFVVGAVAVAVDPGSDVDLYCVGCTEDEADAILHDASATLVHFRKLTTPNAVTFAPMYGSESTVQIVLRLYATPVDVLWTFDLAPCKVAAWFADPEQQATEVRATASWVEAMRRMTFAVDRRVWGEASVPRVIKYVGKGFDAVVPGVRRSALKPPGVLASLLCNSDAGVGGVFAAEDHIRFGRYTGHDRPTLDACMNAVSEHLQSDYGVMLKFQRRLVYAIKTGLNRLLEMLWPRGSTVAQPTWTPAGSALRRVHRPARLALSRAFDMARLAEALHQPIDLSGAMSPA
jgi:hypothetical protein